ncbi:MAG TPA: TetR/AcrR family transcriptional regulator [Thermoleophilaceae bacterium]|nr:TetR/AcrR family transcriptional regulator [Thermoleophilaceae bacterium]
MAVSNASRTRLPRAERMEQTVAAAHALFAERGYAAVTMDGVAAAVGVTKPLLYNYFGNKEQLYLACLERAGDGLVATVVEAVGETSNPTEALSLGLHAFFGFVDQDRAAWAVLFDETLPAGGEIAEQVAGYRTRLRDLIAASMLEQLPPRSRERARTEVEALSTAIMGAAEALVRWWLRTGAMPAAEAAELLISTVEPGLRRRSEPAKASQPNSPGDDPPR